MQQNKKRIKIKNSNNYGLDRISMIAEFDGNEEELFKMDPGSVLPVLPLRNMVLFPTAVLPVSVGRESSLKLIREMYEKKSNFAVVCQKDHKVDEPTFKDIYNAGTVAKVIKIFDMPDGNVTALLQGIQRVRIKRFTRTSPYIRGSVERMDEILPNKNDAEYKTLLEDCRDTIIRIMELTEGIPAEAIYAIKNIQSGVSLINYLCLNSEIPVKGKIEMLEEDSLIKRAYTVLKHLKKELAVVELREKIRNKTHIELDKQQREYFLNQQIKNIQQELGAVNTVEQDANELRLKACEKYWEEEPSDVFEREVRKLERLNIQSPDYNVQLNYLQVMLSLPWSWYSEDNLDIKNAKVVLDKDHYGLEKVKERILEHLAVIKLRGDLKSPIICLYGPPGVGKTSLGKSIANALNRKYVRMSLGGVHDESEIRGHRKTYIGAMPGRILKGMIKAGTGNPVFILDEIDKVGQDAMHGSPASALLEVLDPEQNNAFHDNFLDIDYDLSKVMFVATANNLNTIPAPLLDRMEIIEVSGYLTEEKVEIARRHLIPEEMKANGIFDEQVSISDKAIESIIENYTRESGVRELKKKIGKICRRIAFQLAADNAIKYNVIEPEHLNELLGTQEFSRDKYQGNEYAGVVVGLAWTAVGGEILYIETSLSKGKGGKMNVTGNLGDVMKESAMLALEYVKSHAEKLDISMDIFEKWNIHLHVPEGAIPKDGPSAGITMATAIASALTQRRVKENIAMTGEITLRGKVLPVGGIKEKILAAKRAGIKEIILCAENKRNIEAIPEIYIKGLKFHYVTDVSEVFDIALLDTKVDNAINFAESEI
ncbi:MAG: endopeptidase La [Bacteroidaceae bacterium]|nr:endopeptidase La [Bacteroidaceae bacterium]